MPIAVFVEGSPGFGHLISIQYTALKILTEENAKHFNSSEHSNIKQIHKLRKVVKLDQVIPDHWRCTLRVMEGCMWLRISVG